MTKPPRRMRFDDAPPSVFDFRFVLGRRWAWPSAMWLALMWSACVGGLAFADYTPYAVRLIVAAAVLGGIPAALVMVDLVLEVLCSLDEADSPEERR